MHIYYCFLLEKQLFKKSKWGRPGDKIMGRSGEGKKTEDGESLFFKALAKNFLLTPRSCFWPTFYQMDYMKR